MKYVLGVLTKEEIELEVEIERLEELKEHPNEELRQINLKNNKERLNEILNAKKILLSHLK